MRANAEALGGARPLAASGLSDRLAADAVRPLNFDAAVLTGLLRHPAQYLRGAMAVTRRNESQKPEYLAQVLGEQHAIVEAIVARDPEAARAAAAQHMRQAARRLQDADAPMRRQERTG